MAYYPPFEEIVAQPDSNRLLEVRRSMRSIIPNIFYFIFSLIVVYVLNYYFYDYEPPQTIPVVKHLSVRWLGLIPMVFLADIFRRYHNDLYIFGMHRLTHLEGRLSLSYKVPVIKYSDVRAITVSQDIFGRLFDYGTISIGTAARDGDELIIEGARDPITLASLVDQMRNYSASIADPSASANGSDGGIILTSSND